MYNLQGYFRLLYIILLCSYVKNAVLYEGSDCESFGVPGICTKARLCPPAVESLKKTESPGLKRCGFVGKDEIVCCPSVKVRESDDSFTSTEIEHFFTSLDASSKRKCEIACEEISNGTKSKATFHIIGGKNAENGEFPHMAALGYDTDEGLSWECSASIISNRFLITAAHCITNLKQLVPKRVRIGITKLDETDPQDFLIKNMTSYPKYSHSSKHNDIALIEVNGKISFTDKIYPACLYSKDDDPLGLIVTGWGKTTSGIGDDRSNILQKAKLVSMPLDKCNVSYLTRSKTIVQTQICAGSNKSDACLGDSGGPLQIQNIEGSFSIVGIVSYGAGCGGVIPGVYTRVSKYLEWIESIVWP